MFLYKIINNNGTDVYIASESMERAIEYYNSKKLAYGIKSIECLFSLWVSDVNTNTCERLLKLQSFLEETYNTLEESTENYDLYIMAKELIEEV